MGVQNCPPFWGLGLLHALDLSFVPGPQVAEQYVQPFQSPHCPSTTGEIKQEIFYPAIGDLVSFYFSHITAASAPNHAFLKFFLPVASSIFFPNHWLPSHNTIVERSFFLKSREKNFFIMILQGKSSFYMCQSSTNLKYNWSSSYHQNIWVKMFHLCLYTFAYDYVNDRECSFLSKVKSFAENLFAYDACVFWNKSISPIRNIWHLSNFKMPVKKVFSWKTDNKWENIFLFII